MAFPPDPFLFTLGGRVQSVFVLDTSGCVCICAPYDLFSGQNIYLQNPPAPSPQNQMVVPLWHIDIGT